MYSDLFKREAQKLEKSSRELKYRRINWRTVQKKLIYEEFKVVAKEAKEAEYPFNLTPFIVPHSENETVVQLNSDKNKTGHSDNKNGIVQSEIEGGCALVVSFGGSGTVLIAIYPYKSERSSTKEDSIILYHDMNPTKITKKVIRKSIKKFLIYSQYSSIYGANRESKRFDYFRVTLMRCLEIRNRELLQKKIMQFLFESLKIFIPVLFSILIAKHI
jgi:hypothetical protein